MIKIAVGEELNLVDKPLRYRNHEGAVMEMHSGGELSIMIMLPDITNKEKEDLKDKKIRINVIEREGMLITYLRYSGTPLIFELPFNPSVYPDNRLEKFNPKNLINVVGVNTTNMIVQTVRVVSAPYDLQDKWEESWKSDYSKYDLWLDELKKKSIRELWEQGAYVGRMGES